MTLKAIRGQEQQIILAEKCIFLVNFINFIWLSHKDILMLSQRHQKNVTQVSLITGVSSLNKFKSKAHQNI